MLDGAFAECQFGVVFFELQILLDTLVVIAHELLDLHTVVFAVFEVIQPTHFTLNCRFDAWFVLELREEFVELTHRIKRLQTVPFNQLDRIAVEEHFAIPRHRVFFLVVVVALMHDAFRLIFRECGACCYSVTQDSKEYAHLIVGFGYDGHLFEGIY